MNLQHIKRHYYESHTTINPTGIVPLGPILHFGPILDFDPSLDSGPGAG